MIRLAGLCLTLLHITAPSDAATEPAVVAVEGGTVLTMVGEPVEGGIVLLSDGKIEAVGPNIEVPDGAARIDARGKTVIPGLIDALSRLYVYPEELTEDGQIVPELRITDGVDPYLKDAHEVLRHGVTSVHVVPGSRSLLGGMSAVLKVTAEPGMIAPVTDCAAVRGQIGVPSGSTTSSLQRLATYTSIREAFLATRDYVWTREKYERELVRYEKKTAEPKKEGDAKPAGAKAEKPDRPGKPAANPTYEVLARVLKREIPLQIEAHRVPDILNALRLKDEFDISLVLLGCSEGYKVAGEIAERDVPVIVAPVSLSFTDPSQLRYGEHSRDNAARLAEAGVQVALGVGGSDGLHSRFVRACAAMAVANGLDRDVALKAVTTSVAEILGVAERVGSIAEGRDADLVIINGDPLDVRAPIELVIQDGDVVFERGAAD